MNFNTQAEKTLSQEKIDRHIDQLETAINGGLPALMPWIEKYIFQVGFFSAFHHCAPGGCDAIFKQLADAGYKEEDDDGRGISKKTRGRAIVGGFMGIMRTSELRRLNFCGQIIRETYNTMPEDPVRPSPRAATLAM